MENCLEIASKNYVFFLFVYPAYSGELCDAASRVAFQKTNVPLDVLRAISLVETGRNDGEDLSSWPWTVNHNGSGYWFPDRASAVEYINAALAAGSYNLDIGCFQINYRWHSENFSSVLDMIDPENNAVYAAEYLKRLYNRNGSWQSAVGSYHSSTPLYSERYLEKFERIYGELNSPKLHLAEGFRNNKYLLLKGGEANVLGSLVPKLPAMRRLIGD